MADNFSLSCELQSFIRDQQKRISNASNTNDIQEYLSLLLDVLTDGVLPTLELSASERNHIKAEFTKKHLVRCSDLLLCEPAVGYLASLDALHREKLEKYFSEGPCSELFLVLVGALTHTSKSDSVNVIVSLLEKFIISKRLVDLFVKNCLKTEESRSGCLNLNEKQNITSIISLPERVANRLRIHSKSVFYPEAYFTEVAQQVKESLEVIHSILASESEKVSLSFLSNVIGRICMTGHGKTLLTYLLPHFENWLSVSPLWSHICHKLVMGVSDSELDPVVENLLKEAQNPQIISKLFCDDVLNNTRLKFLMTTKFLLLRYYSDSTILRNIVGYFSQLKSREILTETLSKLLDSWGNSSAIQHTPYHQHVYISCAIVHITGYLGDDDRQQLKHDVLKKLLVGVQNHLESADHKVRRLGMIMAECLTSAFEPNTEKLRFEYSEDDESKLIKELLKGPQSELVVNSCVNKPLFEASRAKGNTSEQAVKNGKIPKASNIQEEEDDDLEAYNLEEDDLEGGRPLYHLRECMETLLESKDVEKFELALRSLEKIVCSFPSDLGEVCTELIKILLHLQDQFSTENFGTLRFKSMVAIATRCPVQAAGFLTEEFYAANYSIIQRLDVLDVIAATAKELSQPVEMTQEKATSKKFVTQQAQTQQIEEIPEWKKVVDERIEKKTRRFIKGPSKEQPKPVANKFANVAGLYFYPLMRNFDQKQNTLDLLGEDHYVLGRLIYTLGILIHYASGAPAACHMGVALIEFSWALRYHHEAIVRQMLVFAVVMVITSVPIALLLDSCREGIFEVHNWLKDLMNKDDNVEVKKTAVQALVVLEDAFKKEMALDKET